MGLQDNTLFDHHTTTDRFKTPNLYCKYYKKRKEALEIVHVLS